MRFLATSSLFVVFALSWTACVGDDPVSSPGGGPAVGDRLGKCFPDKKCKEGLECRLPEEICLTPGEPTPLPDGGTTPDGGAEDDGGTPIDSGPSDATGADSSKPIDGGACSFPPSTSEISCGGSFCGSTGCCATAANKSCMQKAACSGSSGAHFVCSQSTQQCGAGNLCCLAVSGNAPVPSICPSALRATQSLCASGCDAGQRVLCTPNTAAADCPPGQSCVATEILLGDNPTPVVFGVCTL